VEEESRGGQGGFRQRRVFRAVEPAAGGAVVMAGKLRRNAMPILLWLLGVPGVVIIILLLMGVF